MSTQNQGGGKKTAFGFLGFLGIIVLKFKFYILAAVKALTFLKVGWLLSPILSVGVYAMLFGWPYAFAIILLLFIHEMGHWIWMKGLGLDPKAPIFIPGVGAYVAMTKLPADQATHAWVALAGPLVGGVGCAALFYAGVQTDNHWMTAAGSTGFMLNLLQLVPAKPLDGGFVIQAISKWLLVPGTGLLFALSVMFHSVLLLIIAVISFFSLVKQLLKPKVIIDASGASVPMPDEQTPATMPQRILIAIAYLGLAGMLAYLQWLSTNDLIRFVPNR